MESLFNATENQEFIARIGRLTPETTPQWGKMKVAQMLAHCQVPLRAAVGDVKFKRGLMSKLVGGLVKKRVLGPTPFKQNLPTDPNFIVRDERQFEPEKERLLELVQRFQQGGPEGLTREAHPFFGKMTAAEWDRLMWKHLDHHLRQFGV